MCLVLRFDIESVQFTVNQDLCLYNKVRSVRLDCTDACREHKVRLVIVLLALRISTSAQTVGQI